MSEVTFRDVTEQIPLESGEALTIRTLAAMCDDWIYEVGVPVDASEKEMLLARQMAERGAKLRLS